MGLMLNLTAVAVGAIVVSDLVARRGADPVTPGSWNGEALPAADDVINAFADLVGASLGSEASQLPSAFEQAAITINPSTYTRDTSTPDQGDRNARAFLDMIAAAEGTAGQADDGYRTLFNYGSFDSYADHPRVRVPFGNTYSTAAGRYQILARTWDGLVSKMGSGALPDFGPDSQDRAALELVRERGALNDVRAGRVSAAIAKVSKVWASLPGANYANQSMRSNSFLLAAYTRAGGSIVS